MNKLSYQEKDPKAKNFQALMKEIEQDTRNIQASEFIEYFKNQCNIDCNYNSL